MDRSVLLVDDHAGFRAEARATLAAGGFEVIGGPPPPRPPFARPPA